MRQKWTENKILDNIRQIIAEIGFFPSQGRLLRIGRKDLIGAITRYGGVTKFKTILGYDARKPQGYWLDINNVCDELRHHFGGMISEGIMPTYKMMSQSGIPPSIATNFGIEQISKILNCRVCKHWIARDGHHLLSYAEYLLDEYLYSRNVHHEPNVSISDKFRYRCDQKVGDYFIEIWGHKRNEKSGWSGAYNAKRRKKEKFYKKFNLNLISIEAETFFQSPEEIENDLNEIFSHIGYNVEQTTNFDIAELGNEPLARINEYWSYGKVLEELKFIVEITGKLPTQKELIKIGRGNLANAISRHGGAKNFYEKLGCPLNKKPNGYWTENTILNEIDKIGYFPTPDQLVALNKWDLLRGISRNGGFTKLRTTYLLKREGQ